MNQSTQQSLPGELTTARRRVDAWRDAQGGVRRRIPEAIWTDAVSLAARHSLTKVSVALGVPYESLRKRFGSKSRRTRGGKRIKPSRRKMASKQQRFVELPTNSLESSVASIELRSPGGLTVVVRTANDQVAHVIAALWKEIP